MCSFKSPAFLFTLVAMAMSGPIAAEDPPEAAAGDDSVAEKSQPLDLRPPDVTKLYTPEQIKAMLARARDDAEPVEVESTREPPPTVTPYVWRAIAAPFWALLHPTQAWRIFAPLPPDQTRGLDVKPDATDPYAQPVIPFR